MNINEFIIETLEPLGLPVVEELYEGDEEEYITFSMADSRAADFGDNDPHAIIYYMQIHYVCPWDADYSRKARTIRKTLAAAGFTYPELTDVSDPTNRIRHLVFECEIENNFDLEED